jgi:hypothetical protein
LAGLEVLLRAREIWFRNEAATMVDGLNHVPACVLALAGPVNLPPSFDDFKTSLSSVCDGLARASTHHGPRSGERTLSRGAARSIRCSQGAQSETESTPRKH